MSANHVKPASPTLSTGKQQEPLAPRGDWYRRWMLRWQKSRRYQRGLAAATQDHSRPASLRTDPDQDCDWCPTVMVRDGAPGMSWSEVVKVAAIAVALSAALAALYAFIAMKTGAPPP